MRVFVTGASGFVGAHLVRRLRADGRHEVAALLRPKGHAWRLDDPRAEVRAIAGDLDGLEAVRPELARFAPEAVIHLAWSGVSGAARNDPSQAENINRTVALVRLAREVGARTFVGLGSQAEYGLGSGALNEDTPTRPTTLYGVAKLAAGLFAGQICRDQGVRFAWLRLFSSYGPMDEPSWMIPNLIRTLLRAEMPALTLGTQLWDFIAVEDVARAIEAVTTTPDASGVFNLGSGRVRTIRSVAEMIRDQINPELPLHFGAVPFRPDQVMHLEADIRTLRAATGWTPETDLADGLARTIDWFRTHGGRS